MNKTKNNNYQFILLNAFAAYLTGSVSIHSVKFILQLFNRVHPVKFARQLFNRINIARQASKYLLVPAISLVVFFGLVQGAEAANHYVRSGATGANNGSDWTNAWTSLPSALTRGDTYYIAGGSYGSYTFANTSGTSLIKVKKATVADHGTDTGWNDDYASGQAVFTGWTIGTNYLLIDGQTGGGPGSWNTGHGIAVKNTTEHLVISNGAISNITFRHIEIDGKSNANADRDALYFLSGANNITMQYIYIHDIGCDIAQFRGSMARFTLEYSKFARNYQGTCHGDVFEYDGGTASNWVHRYNMFEDTVGTYLWGTHESGRFDGAEIYGNIIYGPLSYFDNGMIAGLSRGGTITNLKFYNNTIQAAGGINMGFLYLFRGTNNLIYNNLYYMTGGSLAMEGTHDYNWYYGSSQSETHIQKGTGNPFTNMTSEDFTLKAATNAGISLSSPYNQDMFGNTRGADGTWDRGAFEYVSGSAPSIHTLTVAKSGSGLGTVSGTGIDCGSDCTETIDTGTSVTLTASADADSVFSGWSGAGCSGTGTCTVIMNSDIKVTAAFNQPGLPVNLLINGDFESGFTNGLGNSWQMTTDGNVVYSVSEDNGHQGSSQKITVTTPGSWGLFFYQTPAFELNQSYTWSFWYKTGGGDLWAEITNGPATQVVFQKQLPDTNGEWQYATYTFQHTNTQATQLRFYSNTVGTYWFEDIQLVAGADTTPPAAPTGVTVN